MDTNLTQNYLSNFNKMCKNQIFKIIFKNQKKVFKKMFQLNYPFAQIKVGFLQQINQNIKFLIKLINLKKIYLKRRNQVLKGY